MPTSARIFTSEVARLLVTIIITELRRPLIRGLKELRSSRPRFRPALTGSVAIIFPASLTRRAAPWAAMPSALFPLPGPSAINVSIDSAQHFLRVRPLVFISSCAHRPLLCHAALLWRARRYFSASLDATAVAVPFSRISPYALSRCVS